MAGTAGPAPQSAIVLPTVIVLDYHAEASKQTGIHAVLYANEDASQGDVYLPRRGVATLAEAALEYCRVAFDLCPGEALVRVGVAGPAVAALTFVHGWSAQSMAAVHQGLDRVSSNQPRRQTDLQGAMREAVEALRGAPRSPESPARLHGRIILCGCHRADTHPTLVELKGIIEEALQAQQGTADDPALGRCEFTWVQFCGSSTEDDQDGTEEQVEYPVEDPTARVITTRVLVPHPRAHVAVRRLLQRQLGLSYMEIKGIPMKDNPENRSKASGQDEKGKKATYEHDVQLLYRRGHELVSSANEDLIMQWRMTAADKRFGQDPDKLPTRSIHLATPCMVLASPTVCLVNHLSKGKVATLLPHEEPDAKGAPNAQSCLTHVLAYRENAIYLHRLYHSQTTVEDSRLDVLKMPTVYPGTSMRYQAFTALMHRNVLVTRGSSDHAVTSP